MGASSVAGELPLNAVRAIEDDLRRLVVGEVRAPAVLVRRQPTGIALLAVWDQRDALGTHGASLERLSPIRCGLDHQNGIVVWLSPGRASMTRRPLPRPSGMASPGCHDGTTVTNVGGSAGVPSSSSSLYVNAIRFSLPVSVGAERQGERIAGGAGSYSGRRGRQEKRERPGDDRGIRGNGRGHASGSIAR
jgi:hypothetical protein